MDKVERIGISLEHSLLTQFDKLITKRGYQSRSEAIRDLVREQLSEEKTSDLQAEAVAAVFLVYDHHATKMSERLIALQHSNLLHVISSLHIHLNAHDCLEIIVLKGQVGQINQVGEHILSMKGVKLGRINLVAGMD
jgi:CopG family nickel-responsive transcriptional regulator